MDKTQTQEAIKVMQAYVDGKEIEFKTDGREWDGYQKFGEPAWSWTDTQYRIKPEPMEIEVWVSPHGQFSLHQPNSLGNLEWKPKTFREVL